MDQLRTHVDALKHQILTLPQQSHAVAPPQRRWRGLASGLFAMGLVVGWIASAAGQSLSCGATLGPGGVFRLQADLECTDVSPALTLRDGAQLDLGGHTLALSVAGGDVAVLLEGQAAVLQNGTVRCAISCETPIRVAGRGKHTVRNVNAGADDSFGQLYGITVVSDSNRLLGNIGSGLDYAFLIQGNKNQLDSNGGFGQSGIVVEGHQNQLVNNSPRGHIGFVINGNKNVLMDNDAIEHGEGIRVTGEGNVLMDNDAIGNGEGIRVTGEGNGIKRNTALGNDIYDLFDAHEDCDKNRWQQNIFEISQAGTTVNPACIQ